jgi:predicted nucleic acid-binding protein
MEVVFDSSTLILLAKTDLLRRLSGETGIVIPPKVRSESLAKDSFDAALIRSLVEEGRIQVEKVGLTKAVRKLMKDFRIERGEAEALWLAKERNCVLAVDDGPTIKACRILGQRFTTAIHFLIHLKKSGRLSTATAEVKLDKLLSFGRYSGKIAEDARRRVKED